MKNASQGAKATCAFGQMSASQRSTFVAQAGMIAAVYAAFTLVCLLFLGGLAWGPVQVRLSECLVVLAVITPAAIPGLTIGCVVANLANMLISGTGALGLLDVVFGSLATLVGALWCRKFAEKPVLALAGPVVANALLVSAYLPILLQGFGYYTIPFTSISLDGLYLPMYLFGVVFVGLGEALSVYVLGLPLLKVLRNAKVFSA